MSNCTQLGVMDGPPEAVAAIAICFQSLIAQPTGHTSHLLTGSKLNLFHNATPSVDSTVYGLLINMFYQERCFPYQPMGCRTLLIAT